MKKLIPFIVIVLLSLFWIWVGISSSNDMIDIIIFQEQYNIVTPYSVEDQIEVKMYLTYEDSYYVRKENVSSAYVQNSFECIELGAKEIKKMDSPTRIDDKKYYGYIFVFDLDVDDNNIIKIPNAELIINYIDINPIKVKIGDVTIKKIPFSHDFEGILNLSTMEGIAEDSTLKAIDLKLKSNENIQLVEAVLFDCHASFDQMIYCKDSNTMCNINGYAIEEEVSIRLHINDSINLNKVGFEIKYEYENNIYSFYYETFTFFETFDVKEGFNKYTYELH